MHILVGLGNPGAKYAHNRHNIGFMVADALVREFGLAGPKAKFQSELYEGSIKGQKVLVMKPQTFMNLSGNAVAEAARFYKLGPEDITVFYDELDLRPGRLRVKRGGGHAGHNGLRSIIPQIGEGFRRVRMGIGHPGDKNLVSGYVLSDFAKADADWLAPLVDAVAAEAPHLLADEDDKFMTAVALKTRPQRENNEKQEDTKDGV